jgi:hypothetical protein
VNFCALENHCEVVTGQCLVVVVHILGLDVDCEGFARNASSDTVATGGARWPIGFCRLHYRDKRGALDVFPVSSHLCTEFACHRHQVGSDITAVASVVDAGQQFVDSDHSRVTVGVAQV